MHAVAVHLISHDSNRNGNGSGNGHSDGDGKTANRFDGEGVKGRNGSLGS